MSPLRRQCVALNYTLLRSALLARWLRPGRKAVPEHEVVVRCAVAEHLEHDAGVGDDQEAGRQWGAHEERLGISDMPRDLA